MLCAIILPSRARPDRLLKTLESVRATIDNPLYTEILIRLDDDDQESLARRNEFEHPDPRTVVPSLMLSELKGKWPRTRVIVGPRGRGYGDLHKMYGELAAATEASWLWMMNDDAVIVGQGWDKQLYELPTTGLLVQPETYQLGFSRYANSEGGAFPIFPNNCWLPEWQDGPENPLDVAIDELLRKRRGWKTHFLPGIEVVHDRDDDASLEAHRALPT